jgi:hypothetical protein
MDCLNGITDFARSKQILEEKNLIVKDYDDLGLYLVKYDKEKCDMTDRDVRMCRGLVLEKDSNRVVCAPPVKSTKIETFTGSLTSLENLVYEEFLDGTMINVFYYGQDWHISTRSCIGANCRWFSSKRFDEMFDESKNFTFDNFDPGYTYTFVLQHNENRIVTSYNNNDLTLVQVVDNATLTLVDMTALGEDFSDIKMRKTYKFSNILEAYSAIENMEYDIQGYIIRNETSDPMIRSKLRNPKYNFVRSLRGNTRNLKYVFLDLRSSNYLNSYLDYFPENREKFREFTEEFYATTRSLFDIYQRFRVRKEIKLQEVPYEFRPLCYELHGTYIKNKTIITFAEVKRYMNNLPPARQLFIMNYKNHGSAEVASTEETVN